MSIFPTSWAISQADMRKGSLHMRSSVLFWILRISSRATIPSQYLWGIFNFLAFKNCFWGALPPTIGQSFFLASFSPPDIYGPSSVAILANCQVGDNSGDLPTSSNLLPLLFSSLPCLGLERSLQWYVLGLPQMLGLLQMLGHCGCPMGLCPCFDFLGLLLFPFLGVTFIHAILE